MSAMLDNCSVFIVTNDFICNLRVLDATVLVHRCSQHPTHHYSILAISIRRFKLTHKERCLASPPAASVFLCTFGVVKALLVVLNRALLKVESALETREQNLNESWDAIKRQVSDLLGAHQDDQALSTALVIEFRFWDSAFTLINFPR